MLCSDGFNWQLCNVFIINVTCDEIVHIRAVKKPIPLRSSLVTFSSVIKWNKIGYRYVYTVGVSSSFRLAATLLCHLVRN